MDFANVKPFEKKHLEEEGKSQDVITIKLNPEQRKMLEEAKRILEQEKDSTAFKQLAYIGFRSITSQEIKPILETIFANKRRNKRLGIVEFEL